MENQGTFKGNIMDSPDGAATAMNSSNLRREVGLAEYHNIAATKESEAVVSRVSDRNTSDVLATVFNQTTYLSQRFAAIEYGLNENIRASMRSEFESRLAAKDTILEVVKSHGCIKEDVRENRYLLAKEVCALKEDFHHELRRVEERQERILGRVSELGERSERIYDRFEKSHLKDELEECRETRVAAQALVAQNGIISGVAAAVAKLVGK